MRKHTPGPWNYAADSLREGRFSIYANGPIAHCGDAAKPGDGEANARLIAAAPELLAALQAIADAESAGSAYPGDGWRLAHEKLCGYARAAIAKAGG